MFRGEKQRSTLQSSDSCNKEEVWRRDNGLLGLNVSFEETNSRSSI